MFFFVYAVLLVYLLSVILSVDYSSVWLSIHLVASIVKSVGSARYLLAPLYLINPKNDRLGLSHSETVERLLYQKGISVRRDATDWTV